MIEENSRIDGRGPTDIRNIETETTFFHVHTVAPFHPR